MGNNLVAILMSIYNPNIEYFRQQLQSIMNQNYDISLIKIFIRDDGSTELNRGEIARVIREVDANVDVSYGDNVGPANSFRALLLNPELAYFSFIAFADQDDVWERNKLLMAINAISKSGDIPTLYYSNASLIDFNSNFLDEQLYANLPENKSIFDIMMHSDIYGMAMVFNRSLLIELQHAYPNFVRSHDHWVAVVAFAIGKIVYTDEMLVRYRQHQKNVVGAISNKPNYSAIMFKHLSHFKRLFQVLFGDSTIRTVESQWLLLNYDQKLHTKVVEHLNLMIKARKSVSARFCLILHQSYRGRNKLATLAIYFRTLLGHI